MLVGKLLPFRRASRSMLRQVSVGLVYSVFAMDFGHFAEEKFVNIAFYICFTMVFNISIF